MEARVGLLLRDGRGGTPLRGRLRPRARRDGGAGYRVVRGGRRGPVPACAEGPDHRVDAYRGEQQEHHADRGCRRFAVAEGEVQDAYAEIRRLAAARPVNRRAGRT